MQVGRHQAVYLDGASVCQSKTLEDSQDVFIELRDIEIASAFKGVNRYVECARWIGVRLDRQANVFPSW